MTEETLQVGTALAWKIGTLRQLKGELSSEDITIEKLFSVIERFNLETDGSFYSSEFKIKLRKECQEAITDKLDEFENKLSEL